MLLPPVRVRPHHGVENRVEVPHARGERDLRRFAGWRGRARPPHTSRLPLSVPLSRARGGTPISAAISLWFRRPSFGTSASSVRLTTRAPHPAPCAGDSLSRAKEGCSQSDPREVKVLVPGEARVNQSISTTLAPVSSNLRVYQPSGRKRAARSADDLAPLVDAEHRGAERWRRSSCSSGTPGDSRGVEVDA